MAALLGGSSTIRTITSANIFNDKTDVAHQHKEASDDDGKNYGSNAVTPIPPQVGKSKVATTTPKVSILFNQQEDIKVGHFGKIEFVDSQRSHPETFGEVPMIILATPTNQNKTMAQKEICSFSELCILEVFIHIIRKLYVGTDNVDDSRSTQEV